jgi:tetratricopeptide (TPR) repeat protein
MGNYIGKVLIIIFLTISGFSTFAQQAKSYEEAITMGDKNFSEKNFPDAKAYYQMALTFKARDEYANNQIKQIVAEMSSQMDREMRYLEILDIADPLFESNKLDEAKQEYAKALAIIPDDKYAQSRIDKINDIQTNQKENLEAFNNLMSKGRKLSSDHNYDEAIKAFGEASKIFPDNKEPSNLITSTKEKKIEYEAKHAVYTEEVELANRYINVKNYAEALIHLNKAYEIFPENWVVKDEIDKYQPLAKNQQEYRTEVEKADKLYVKRNYASAKALYEKASILWPENNYASDMISKIDESMAEQMKNVDANYQKSILSADSLFASNDLTSASAEYNFASGLKPQEQYPKTKIDEIEAIFEGQRLKLEADYANIIKSADSLFALNNYSQSKVKYVLALTVRPDDQHPKNQLDEIENLLLAQAKQNELQLQYNAIIADADAFVVSKEYDDAIGKYNDAIALKSNEEYPAKRIADIENLISNAAKQQEIDENYASQMALAKRLFSENNLKDAKNTFLAASEIKPLETEPKAEITKIDLIINEKETLARIDKQYQTLVNKGDSLHNLKMFDESIVAFTEALTLKPADIYATDKIQTVQANKIEHEKLVASEKAYEKAIKEADALLANKEYLQAKTIYKTAIGIKDNETYPSNKIAEIDGILAHMAAENTRKYNEAIVKADNFFEASNLSEAVMQYKIASSIKPEETYPKQRIAESNTLIEEKLRLVRSEYNLAIADADKLYATKIYDKAIVAYQKADKIYSEENYPEEMIEKILKLIETNAIVDIVKDKILITSGTTEKLSFEPVRINVRKSNYIFVKAKNVSGKPFKIIFGYGKDKGKNGGFVVQVPEGNEQNDYIIRVGNQYKWFSEDNNWISVYPENGDVEISLLRISTSD